MTLRAILYIIMYMSLNILYIHGFNGNPKGGTYKVLKEYFSNENLFSFPFPKLHTDVVETSNLIESYCRDYNINLIIGASLGAFYALNNTICSKRIAINPCMLPSKEIENLKDRITGLNIHVDDDVKKIWLDMESYKHVNEEVKKNTFGIFGKNDELFHYKTFFDEIFGIPDSSATKNSILVEGHHSMEKEYLIQGLKAFSNYIN